MTFVSRWIESYFDEQYQYLWQRIRKRPKDMSCPVSPLLPTNSRIRVRYGDIPEGVGRVCPHFQLPSWYILKTA
jgi:hypothetical protein